MFCWHLKENALELPYPLFKKKKKKCVGNLIQQSGKREKHKRDCKALPASRDTMDTEGLTMVLVGHLL